ncbi:MAG TPA: pyruvate:ferredoxin (flavodoxin) oxidoreductase [Bryobacteraceae bacterium]|nr:pyruvate:ferredoxin (flavodoxin) oxidoreductase [Bryobacteraceae bacterium]
MDLKRLQVTLDGNEAAAYVAHRVNEVIAIYPITPSSPMGEWADQWSSTGATNIWGSVPSVIEMQSEGGAAGAVHGALQGGALTTTFTSSQGLLLMIPNMYKIAGELTPAVFHVAARALAAQGLSIFGDHQDVMAVRSTGFAMLASHSVQAVMDMALIAQAAALESRLPFVHFFDGFRTSHEVAKVEQLSVEDLRAMINDDLVNAHRARSLNPDRPVLRGTAQNPDVYFQARETVNPFYDACPEIVQRAMDRFASLTGRQYRLFDYYGAPDADRVVVLMGSSALAAEECVDALRARGEHVGLINVHLFRPFSAQDLVNALPSTVQAIAVLDRTKEPGSAGEPLYQDVVTALQEAGQFNSRPRVIGGRYGLASKEFTPAMCAAVFDELRASKPRNHFVIGIQDDVSHHGLDYDAGFSTEDPETVRAVFYGLGADGTVGANKNSIKIIGESTGNHAQGYFVYDSKKSGAMTISHLRFGRKPIRASYLITRASFVACHQFSFLERMDVFDLAEPGATFLLNSPFGPEDVWEHLPASAQRQIIEKRLRFYVIDAYRVAKDNGMGGRINTVMQTCFFALSGALPRDEAIAAIKHAIEKTYGKRGEAVVEKNFAAVDHALANLHEVAVSQEVNSSFDRRPVVSSQAPEFVHRVLAPMMAGRGESLPVSALPVDGTYPTATSKWEKRNLAQEIPVWEKELCIQCGKCVLVCPHAVIRSKLSEPELLRSAPAAFKSAPAHWKDREQLFYALQVSPEDCTGCGLCVQVCPAKSKSEAKRKALNMAPQAPIREQERHNWEFFLQLPEFDRSALATHNVKDVQLLEPLFEFPGACAGCGETPYIKLLTQLFGDRTVIANATGCSSIYGGNLPTTPYTVNRAGRGPAWSNSLFEDNAEFGLGIRVALDKQTQYAGELLRNLAPEVGEELAAAILEADQSSESGISQQRQAIRKLEDKLAALGGPQSRDLRALTGALARKSVWILGGDGWAYDIGYGGLDHVFASGRNVKILVLDTEVYSNTGGQASKSTPRGAVAKFASSGKRSPKKDLAMMAMTYGTVYVAHVALGASDTQTVKAFLEAEAYDGPALIIAYAHCIAHGYDLIHGLDQQKAAVQSAYWPLFRYHPELAAAGKNAFQLDSRPPSIPLEKYVYNEGRYAMLARSSPETAAILLEEAQKDVNLRWKLYEHWASFSSPNGGSEA